MTGTPQSSKFIVTPILPSAVPGVPEVAEYGVTLEIGSAVVCVM